MQHNIREAKQNDCEIVAQFAAQTFTDTFGHLYRPENLLHHILHKCSAAFFENALTRGDTILMMEEGETPIGYAKVGPVELPLKTPAPRGSQEIHRVYVARAFQGRGYGKQLMLHMMGLPRIAHAPAVYLGVWEENLRAQQLYTQYGFKVIGKYLYQVGDQYDNEIMMMKSS